MANLQHRGTAFADPRWKRIDEALLDDPRATFPLSDRLARENAWSSAYAARVTDEYRRFCYLAMTAGREVTPSDAVDQAWHLHLLYTEHYWNTWTEALGGPLHHGPTKGGSSERARYRANYEATLDAYEAAFGAQPPADIWPCADERFANPGAMKRVDTSRLLMVERSTARAGMGLAAGLTALGALGLLPAGGSADALQAGFMANLEAMGPGAFVVGGFVLAGILLIVLGLRRRTRRTGGASSGGVIFGGGSGKSGDGDGGSDGGGTGCSGCGGCGG